MASLIQLTKRFGAGLALALVSVGILLLVRATSAEHKLPVSAANGIYENSQGSALVLRDGLLSTGGKSASYVIEIDKMGPYVLVDRRLNIDGAGFVQVGSDQGMMKSHMDDSKHPSVISFWMWRSADYQSLDRYEFRRAPQAGVAPATTS
jgi:hypothetical protein